MTTKPQPRVYATRPACKWHGYNCHRPVAAGDTLCAYHRPVALAKSRVDQAYKAGYRGPLTATDIDRIESALGADPGCDCAACLRQAAPL
jgi:hypothetical protein